MSYYWRDHTQGLSSDAIKAGIDKDGGEIYLGRAFHLGETLPAKIIPNHRCAYVGWDGKEHRKDQYEILCKGQSTVLWQEAQNGNVPPGALAVGITTKNEKLYFGRVFHDGTLTPGKIHPSYGVCYITFNGKEIGYKSYETLVVR